MLDTPEVAQPDGSTTSAHPAFADDLYCPECGYNLRGLTSNRCPECGLVLDFIESETSIIPWERRRELGRFRAYWQTVLEVSFRRKKFCRAFYQSVSYRDAQLFRWIAIAHAYVLVLLVAPATYVFESAIVEEVLETFGVPLVAYWYGCLLLFLTMCTGVASYFFHPGLLTTEQQNRAIALSYYGCAPLAGMPLTLPFYCAALVLRDRPHELDLVGVSIAVVLAILLVVFSANEPVEIGKRILRGKRSGWLLEGLISVAWLVTMLGTLVVLPALGLYVAVIFYSVRGSGLGG